MIISKQLITLMTHFVQPDEDILHFNERFLNSETQIMFEELNGIITVEEIQRSINQLKMDGVEDQTNF